MMAWYKRSRAYRWELKTYITELKYKQIDGTTKFDFQDILATTKERQNQTIIGAGLLMVGHIYFINIAINWV